MAIRAYYNGRVESLFADVTWNCSVLMLGGVSLCQSECIAVMSGSGHWNVPYLRIEQSSVLLFAIGNDIRWNVGNGRGVMNRTRRKSWDSFRMLPRTQLTWMLRQKCRWTKMKPLKSWKILSKCIWQWLLAWNMNRTGAFEMPSNKPYFSVDFQRKHIHFVFVFILRCFFLFIQRKREEKKMRNWKTFEKPISNATATYDIELLT